MLDSDKTTKQEEIIRLNSKISELQSSYEQKQEELLEAEKLVQECLEEKKKSYEKSSTDLDLSKAIETLRSQLGAQQQSVAKYDAKIKKRESEVRPQQRVGLNCFHIFMSFHISFGS